MAYSFVNYNYVNHTGTDDPSWAFDIGTRTNGLLIISFYLAVIGDTDPVTGVTWNGVSMSQTGYSAGTTRANYEYRLKNPANGSNTLQINHTGDSLESRSIAEWYDGANQTTVLHQGDVEGTGASGTPTVTITPTVDNTLVHSFLRNEENTAPTVGSGETLVVSIYATGRAIATSYDVQTTAEAQAMDWSLPLENDTWYILASSYLEEAAAADEKVPELLVGGRQVLVPRSRL